MKRKRKLPDSSRLSGDEEEACPEWLSKLLKEENFSKECQQHSPSKMNYFCLDCCIPICFHCNPTHKFHKSMQIYQFFTMNSVRPEDLDEFFDCDGFKKYKKGDINLVYIPSVGKRSSKIEVSYANQCRNCGIKLRGSGIYCSLDCKVEHCKPFLKDLIKYWGSERVETVETSAANHNATLNLDLNETLDEVSGNGTTAPDPNVTSNEASGSRTHNMDLNKTPSPDED